MKVVINARYGGFGVTEAVYKEMGLEWDGHGFLHDTPRDDPKLIAAIETVGLKESSGWAANLKIVDVPDDVDWYIHEYDGLESVYEKHRSWS